MNILLLGKGGQVGWELQRSLAVLGEVTALDFDSHEHCGDFSNPQGVAETVRALRPQVIVNAAAHTAVDKAESDAVNAFRINAEAPGALARACAAADVPLVHYSTDYVFDGQGTRPYREDDPTAPLGVYGASKLAGEVAVHAAGGRGMVFRTAWVYAAHGHNFLRTMLRVGAEREELRVVADQVGTPTPAALIADVTAIALSKALAGQAPDRGTWHLVAAGHTTWHGFAEAIFAEAVAAGLLPAAPKVAAISTSEYPTPARRPACSQLDITRLRHDFGVDPPHWRDGLRSVISSMEPAI